jgi:RND family efflux transporter MFP subunit
MRRLSTPLLLVLLLFPLTVLHCSRETPPQGAPPARVSATSRQIELRDVPDYYEVSGTLVSRNPVTIVAKVMGTVHKVSFTQGQRISRGDVLALIDAPDIKASSDRAASAAAEAENALAIARADAEFAENTFKRYDALYKEKAVSQQEFESIETKKRVALDQVKRMQSLVAQARAEKQRSEAQLAFATIVAPVTGIITAKQIYEGSTVLPGSALLTLETEDLLRLEINADERMLPRVKRGMQVSVQVSALGTEYTGTIGEVVPAVDPQSRTFPVKIDLPQHGALKLGMYASVRIPLGLVKKIMIPKEAVLTRGQLSYAYVLDGNDIARMRLVRTGKAEGSTIEIVSGLSGGERIVVKLGDTVQEGVKIVP